MVIRRVEEKKQRVECLYCTDILEVKTMEMCRYKGRKQEAREWGRGVEDTG